MSERNVIHEIFHTKHSVFTAHYHKQSEGLGGVLCHSPSYVITSRCSRSLRLKELSDRQDQTVRAGILQQGDSQVSEPCHDRPANGVAQRAGGWQTGAPLFRSASNRNFL